MRTIYLLHFSAPIGSDRHSAQHYIGSADDLDRRLTEHRSGRGAAITRALIAAGGDLALARTWFGDRALERRIKKMGHAARLCPVCAGDDAYRRAGGCQLALDVDEEFPDPPRVAGGSYEYLIRRAWRAAQAAPIVDLAAIDELL